MYRLSRNVPTLLSLLKICEHGSINKAAEVLNISQPALTRSIARLEQSLGVEIFERNAKGVTPTAYGDILLVHARNLEAELKNTLDDLASLKNNQQKAIRLGATPLVAAHFMPAALEAVYSRHPDVTLRLTDANRPILLGQLRRNELDCVVATLAFERDEEDLVRKPLFELDLRVIVRSGHPLAKLGVVSMQQLVPYKWILPRADSGLYRRVETDFKRAGLSFPGSVLETTSPETTKALVRSTDLVAVLPLQALAGGCEGVVSLTGDWSFARRAVGMYMRKEPSHLLAYRTLTTALRAVGQTPVRRQSLETFPD